MNLTSYYLTPSELENPRAWFFKAQRFRSAVKCLLEEFKLKSVDGAKMDDVALIQDAVNTIPYLTCLGLELYMKGVLVSEGIPSSEVRIYSHEIWEIRKKCFKQTRRKEFSNLDLQYVTDKLGPHILDDGGVRYPGKRDSAIPIDSCLIALDVMHDLLSEIVKSSKS